MKLYAQVDTSQTPGVVDQLIESFDDAAPPVAIAPFELIDVTDVTPPPKLGYVWDGTTFAESTQQINRATLMAKAATALQTNADYLALNPPTTAQSVAQVAALTRQVTALIRLVMNHLDSTSGT